ncbi:hypothetical protein [Nanchangia anserum]|uniref:Uncharacterized protein n=1 Tax=Nanchangia anserum TaxID=2692125 RepID=A0A8I0GG35_9ACTO|nr:hypothetical protein [Nanchangia anserum]MBD3689389.1 hypothetical protein [Nanchangia anserum]
MRWPWERWRTYRLNIDGRRFVAHVSPFNADVEWINCPSEYLPAGYGSHALVRATTRWEYYVATLRLYLSPLPTRSEVEADIRHWLATLDDDEDD